MLRFNRRMLRLLVPFAVLVVLALLLRFTFWGGDGSTLAGDGGPAAPDAAGRLEVALGEEAVVVDVVLVVTALAPVDKPARPVTSVSSPPVALGAGQAFYQALAVMRNGATKAARLDPRDFVLLAGNARLRIDQTRSGPPSLTLLPGASADLVLTFIGPPGLEPQLEYRPPWSSVRVVVKGERRPVGMAVSSAGSAAALRVEAAT